MQSMAPQSHGGHSLAEPSMGIVQPLSGQKDQMIDKEHMHILGVRHDVIELVVKNSHVLQTLSIAGKLEELLMMCGISKRNYGQVENSSASLFKSPPVDHRWRIIAHFRQLPQPPSFSPSTHFAWHSMMMIQRYMLVQLIACVLILQLILEEGQPAVKFVCILEGFGTEYIGDDYIQHFQAGNVVGENFLLSGLPRESSLVCADKHIKYLAVTKEVRILPCPPASS